MFWHVSVHPSICLSTSGGVPLPGPAKGWRSPSQRGGTPPWVPPVGPGRGYPEGGTPPWAPPLNLARGYPDRMGCTPPQVPPCQTWWGVPWWGVPHLGYLPLDLAGGTLMGQGVPHLRYPPVRPGRGTLMGGIPPWVPPVRPGQGGTPDGEGTPPRVVLDIPRLVCLLRSRRRTFLFCSLNTHQLLQKRWHTY